MMSQEKVYNAFPLNDDISNKELYIILYPGLPYSTISKEYMNLIKKLKLLRDCKMIRRSKTINNRVYHERLY